MSEKRFFIDIYTLPTTIVDSETSERYSSMRSVVGLLNEQQATIEEYEDFCLNLCKFLIGKGLVDKYREEYGKEYKIITKWKGCGSDE